MKFPPIESPTRTADLPAWWEEWVKAVRNSPQVGMMVEEEQCYYGEHLFIGSATHKKLFRARRAVGVSAGNFSDAVEYQDVSDLRAWADTEPEALLLHEGILGEHCYIVGPSGAGKTSLGIIPLLIQLMRGTKTKLDYPSPPYPLVILDLKGDPALFHSVRIEAEKRGQKFQFFTTEKNAPTYRFNPFRGFDRESRTVAQLCQLIMDALSLNHGKGYGRSYYTERTRNVLSLTLKRHPNIVSFDDLHSAIRSTMAGIRDTRAKNDAFELLSVIEMLTEYRQLVTNADEDVSNTDGIIFMPKVIEERQVAYFWLPAALESISVGEIAKLVLFNLRIATQDWKRNHPDDRRQVILVIDELQRVAGENLRGILQDARSFGISAILANQSLKDLKSPTGFDLAPTIMTNTRAKFFFTTPSEKECFVFVERGKGFTAARPFPERGHPWLRDLAPEELGYQVRLAWPIPLDEYRRREATPLPTWGEIPGGDYWVQVKKTTAPLVEIESDPDALPHDFEFKCDAERSDQLVLIQGLFTAADGVRTYGDDMIDDLLRDEPREDEDEEE